MLTYIFIGILGAATLLEIIYYLVYLDAVNRRIRRSKKTVIPVPKHYPMVSVIICARNEADNLREFLPKVLTQKYPNYEVIVVDDESQDDTRLVIEQYQQQYPNLRTTFVPHEARIRSSKKLALTLAAKAAKGEYLLLTDADCYPDSDQWIRKMQHGFDNGAEVVLGYGAYIQTKGLLNRLIQYDTLFSAMQYLGMALMGHPYMGVGRNLAYTKELFFREKGFAGLLGTRAGDDDLFVNKVAHRGNTNIVVTTGSETRSVPKHTFSEWILQKRRHLSVSPQYATSTKWLLTAEPTLRGLFYMMIIIVCLQPYWWCWCAGAGCFLLRYLTQLLVINPAAKHFKQRRFWLAFIAFDIFLPVNSLILMTHNAIHKKQLQQW